ncbi:hypothetical protein [Campylobacter sp.]|uniref:hypothetical protein n=1 Tax=Campylobacter sp. TaxID=205 RepID=UPI002A5FD855|nr:hypothetical protein [Campylobacter sp.]MDD7704357.1 hypothetical protein [Campylobacteraceae bacterium]MDY2635878.1 hypothetical protein [Campylobacter sp.]
MKVILLNQNPAVSRLVRLSIEKIGYKLEEYSNIAQLDEQNPADVFICDHELVDDSVDYTPFGKHIIFLVPRNFAKKLGKHTLEKPFLPTDFMDFVKRVATSGDDETELQESSSSDFSDTSAENFSSDINDLDLDSFGDFDTLADDDLASRSDSTSKPSDESGKSDEGLSGSELAQDLDEPSELDTKNLDDILGQLDFEDDESKQTSDESKEVAQITEVSEKSDEGLDTTLSESFVEGGEDDLIEDRIPAQLASSDVNEQDDLIEESIPENLADEKKEQLAQLSSMVDEIDNMDEQKSSAEQNDSLDMTDFKELVGVSDKAETKEESTNEVAELEKNAEDLAPADEIEELDEVVADEMPASSKLTQEEQVASLKEEMAKAEEKTAAVTDEGNEDIELSEAAGIAEASDEVASNEVVADEVASDDDSLDMTDFKDLVGVSDDDIAETSDEISKISEVQDEISKVAKIAEVSDEIVTDEVASDNDSLDMTDFKDLVGVSDDDIAETSDEISEISEVKDEISKVAEIAEASDEIVADEVAKTSDEISEISEVSDKVASGDDEFAGISESDLARALGLDIAGLSSEQEKPKEQKNNADIEQAKSQISSQITETIGATLASSPALKEAIKGMKIKINISFEE